jgi:hypothetical protein
MCAHFCNALLTIFTFKVFSQWFIAALYTFWVPSVPCVLKLKYIETRLNETQMPINSYSLKIENWIAFKITIKRICLQHVDKSFLKFYSLK